MTITGSQQALGSLAAPTQPVTVDWHWGYALLPAYPWLLVSLLFLLKPNRSMNALAVLLPAVASTAMLFALSDLAGGLSMYMPSLTSHLILGVAVLMLVSARYAAFRTGLGVVFSAFILLLGFGIAAVIAETWTFTSMGIQSMVFEFITYIGDILVILAGLVVAGRLCRRRLSILRLTISFGIGALVLPAVFVILVLAFETAIVPDMIMTLVPIALGKLAVTPLVFMALLFPFVLLVAFNSLYRGRLERAIRALPLPEPQPAMPDLNVADAPPAAEETPSV